MAEFHLLSPRGFRAGGVHAGIKTARKSDVGLLVCDVRATAAAMFTSNKVVAAPIVVGREHVASGALRGIVVNSGNANACTRAQGRRDAREMCRVAAAELGCRPTEILPSSTGVIGHFLPMDRIRDGIARASRDLGSTVVHANRFADAILTTDTRRKSASATLRIGRSRCTIAGICKGAGMIAPRLIAPHATMLAFLTTDALISAPALRKLLAPAVNRSFNAVTIDDHMSPNDTAVILASGMSGAKVVTIAAARSFLAALTEVCQSLAKQIAADGEGATKLVTVTVTGAPGDMDARRIARAIADSPLVKCAMNGSDPNWGRIVSAAGMCGARFDANRTTLRLQRTRVFARGRPWPFDSARLSRALRARQVLIELECGLGACDATIWTCDLSKGYVTINADYHT
ncbi:MAG: bifunctional glutamate N-acetyltransferase/amino-acid acetyltransferase ArgJ [Tepidisphaeraceae bacterium]